jgi:FAD/FMN-containing dehydrogenase
MTTMPDTGILRPGETRYDEARQVWNAMVDRRPAMIVRCRETRDVVAAISLARREGLEIPAEDEMRIAAARESAARLERFASGAYVNVLGDDGMAGIRRAYRPEKLARLTALKNAFDPDNVFHLNPHIPPTNSRARNQLP